MLRGLLSRRHDSLSQNGIVGGVFNRPTEARHRTCSLCLCHSRQAMGLLQESRSDVLHQVERPTGDLRGAALLHCRDLRLVVSESAGSRERQRDDRNQEFGRGAPLAFPTPLVFLECWRRSKFDQGEARACKGLVYFMHLVLMWSPFKKRMAGIDAGVAGRVSQSMSEPSSRA